LLLLELGPKEAIHGAPTPVTAPGAKSNTVAAGARGDAGAV